MRLCLKKKILTWTKTLFFNLSMILPFFLCTKCNGRIHAPLYTQDITFLTTDGFRTTSNKTNLEAPTKFIRSKHAFVDANANDTFTLLLKSLKALLEAWRFFTSCFPSIYNIFFPSFQPKQGSSYSIIKVSG